MTTTQRILCGAIAIALGPSGAALPAQSRCTPASPIVVGSAWEEYLRVAQTMGAARLQPWTVRGFGPRQSRDLMPRDSALPWARFNPPIGRASCGRIGSVTLLPIRAQALYNSGFPFGKNDGAIWAGRGVTLAVEGGFSAAAGPLTLTFNPIAFTSQNAAFTLGENGMSGVQSFADWRNPRFIDLPQRFGDRHYTEIDLGQSTLRLDFAGASVGVSTANQYWGPAVDHPIILGNNAPGFPHVFVGSEQPVRVWRLGRMHARVFWGRTYQTPYSPSADSAVAFLASGIAAVFQPSVFPGLELGGSRFFHVLQDRFRLDRGEILRPFGALLKVARARQLGTLFGDEAEENQLASIFARLVLPADMLELYGEYGREDHNWDLREFWLIPDHDAAYLIGARKVWRRPGSTVSLRGEILNSRVSHLAISSNQAPWYIHGSVLPGHTNKGQALGSAAAYGGGAATLALDLYANHGRWTLRWERLQLGDSRTASVAPNPFKSDIAHVWTLNRLRFGERVDAEFGVSAIYEINRHARSDAGGVQTFVALAPHLRSAMRRERSARSQEN